MGKIIQDLNAENNNQNNEPHHDHDHGHDHDHDHGHCHDECPPQIEPFHARITNPISRAVFAVERGWLAIHDANEMEGGKNYPALTNSPLVWFDNEGGRFQDHTGPAAGQPQPVPPADGYILSGGRAAGREIVNFTDAELMQEKGVMWPRTKVYPTEIMNITWTYSATHKTRGYRFFITRDGWSENRRPTRADFEPTPFYSEIHPYDPYWSYGEAQLSAIVEHNVPLPANKTGHHIILIVWLVADVGTGFYQAIDVDFYDQTAPTYPNWQANQTYFLGDRVSFEGQNWQAGWTNRNIAPNALASGQNPWRVIS